MSCPAEVCQDKPLEQTTGSKTNASLETAVAWFDCYGLQTHHQNWNGIPDKLDHESDKNGVQELCPPPPPDMLHNSRGSSIQLKHLVVVDLQN